MGEWGLGTILLRCIKTWPNDFTDCREDHVIHGNWCEVARNLVSVSAIKWPSSVLIGTWGKHVLKRLISWISNLNMKVLIFAKDENMWFFKTTAYDWKFSPFSDHTNISHELQLLSFLQRLRYVHHSQATPITYTFLVADYWSSTATLSYKPLWQFGEVRT